MVGDLEHIVCNCRQMFGGFCACLVCAGVNVDIIVGLVVRGASEQSIWCIWLWSGA